MNIADKVLQLKQDFDDVYEAGKNKEWSDFWDSYQQNGNRTDYLCAFAGRSWTTDNLKPKYKLRPKNANRMFLSLYYPTGKSILFRMHSCRL